MYNGQSEARSASNLIKQNKTISSEYSRPRVGSYTQYKQQKSLITTTNYQSPNLSNPIKQAEPLTNYTRRNSVSFYDPTKQSSRSRRDLDFGMQKYGSRDLGMGADRGDEAREIRQIREMKEMREMRDTRKDITSRHINADDYSYMGKLRVKNYDDGAFREAGDVRLTDRYNQYRDLPYQKQIGYAQRQSDKSYLRLPERPLTGLSHAPSSSVFERKKSMTNPYQQQSQYFQGVRQRGQYQPQQFARQQYEYTKARQKLTQNSQEVYRSGGYGYANTKYDKLYEAGARKRENVQPYLLRHQRADDYDFKAYPSRQIQYGASDSYQRGQIDNNYRHQRLNPPMDLSPRFQQPRIQQSQYPAYSKGSIRPNACKYNSIPDQTAQSTQRELGYVPSRGSFRTQQFSYSSKSQNATPTKVKNVYDEPKYQQEPLTNSRKQQLISKSKMLKDKLNQLSADKKLIISGSSNLKDVGIQNKGESHQQRLQRLRNNKDRLYQSPFKDSTNSTSNLRSKYAQNSAFQIEDQLKNREKYLEKHDYNNMMKKQKSNQLMKKVNLFTKQEISQNQQNKKSSHMIASQSQSMNRINSLNSKINDKINSIISAYGK